MNEKRTTTTLVEFVIPNRAMLPSSSLIICSGVYSLQIITIIMYIKYYMSDVG